jgi:hypothetical protein
VAESRNEHQAGAAGGDPAVGQSSSGKADRAQDAASRAQAHRRRRKRRSALASVAALVVALAGFGGLTVYVLGPDRVEAFFAAAGDRKTDREQAADSQSQDARDAKPTADGDDRSRDGDLFTGTLDQKSGARSGAGSGDSAASEAPADVEAGSPSEADDPPAITQVPANPTADDTGKTDPGDEPARDASGPTVADDDAAAPTAEGEEQQSEPAGSSSKPKTVTLFGMEVRVAEADRQDANGDEGPDLFPDLPDQQQQGGASDENSNGEGVTFATVLELPRSVSFEGPGDETVRGEVIRFDQTGLTIRTDNREQRLAWTDLEPATIYTVHAQLLERNSQAWLVLGKRLAVNHDSARFAKKALREAVRIDPELAPLIKKRWPEWRKQIDKDQ